MVLWEFAVHSDRKIVANRPDIIIYGFQERTCTKLDVNVPADKHFSLKQFGKPSNCKDMEIEVTKMWKIKTKTSPVVIGAVGMIKKGI